MRRANSALVLGLARWSMVKPLDSGRYKDEVQTHYAIVYFLQCEAATFKLSSYYATVIVGSAQSWVSWIGESLFNLFTYPIVPHRRLVIVSTYVLSLISSKWRKNLIVITEPRSSWGTLVVSVTHYRVNYQSSPLPTDFTKDSFLFLVWLEELNFLNY